jgi:hypothetical protein
MKLHEACSRGGASALAANPRVTSAQVFGAKAPATYGYGFCKISCFIEGPHLAGPFFFKMKGDSSVFGIAAASHMQSKYGIFFVVVLCFLTQFLAADITVETTGYGSSEEQARHDALRNAVEQAAGVKIFSTSLVRDFVALQDVLITESFGLVTSYEVLGKEEKSKDKIWEVKVRAAVSKDIDTQWAKIRVVLEQKGNPSIMFCLKETLDGQELPYPTAEYQLVQKLKELGFKVIDRQWAEDTRLLQKQIYNVEQNYDGVVSLASKHGADLIVIGLLEGNFTQFVDWYEGVQGILHTYNFRTKVIRTATAQMVGSITKTFQPAAKDYTTLQYSREAAGKAGFAEIMREQYLQPMLVDMVKTWINEIQDGAELSLIVSNVKFLERNKVLDTLRNQADIISAVYIDHYRNQRLELRVKAKVSAEDLADKMEKIKDLPLEVVELKKNWLEVRYKTE